MDYRHLSDSLSLLFKSFRRVRVRRSAIDSVLPFNALSLLLLFTSSCLPLFSFANPVQGPVIPYMMMLLLVICSALIKF